MDDAFRAFILGLGILLGFVEGGKDPALAARLYRNDEAVFLSAEVREFVSPSMRKLVDSGNEVTIILSVLRDGAPMGSVERTLKRTGNGTISFRVSSSSDPRALETPDEEAAYILLGQFPAIEIDKAADLEKYFAKEKPTLRISAYASVRVGGAGADESSVLWNYKRPNRVFSLRSLTEVPY
jgi:hypothetical protein